MEEAPKTKAEEIEIKFNQERKSWTDKIVGLAESQRKIENLTNVLVDCHSNRQILLDNVFDLNRTVFKLNNKIVKLRAEQLRKYTDTSKLDSSAYRYSEKDREKLIEAELSEPKNNLALITNQIEFLRESVKTVDNMIWNIRYRIDLENLRM